jgi:pyruvate dehydrogenase E2 component (dihydrolipoamide acetyltransferase)
LELKKLTKASVFRKIAMGSWRTASDPSVYGLLEIDVTPALKWIEENQKKTANKISISHLVGKAVAHVMAERPEINGMIRFSRIYHRKHVDLFYQVNIPGDPANPVAKATLSGVTVRKAETMSVMQIADELGKKAQHLKKGGKNELSKSMNTLGMIPWSLVRFFINTTSFLNYDLRLNLTWAGMPRDPFGSVMITNVGSIGVDLAWAPLVPYTKVPLLLTVGAIRDRAWAVNGKCEVRPI